MIPRQYRIHVVLMITAALMIIVPLLNEKPDADKAKLATAAATEFLSMVDHDHFESSWKMSAKLMQERVPLEEWREQLVAIRQTLGPLVKREQSDISYATVAKDSPEGEYIQIFYDSQFGAKPKVEEILTVMLEPDGQWRVAGYFVQ